ncbi:hypothetical protein D5086_033014 [Populus alba]|uniref:Uncharacterized protein n=1 Tax=Populus alba TaxID=43335 RepID=A0ACC4AFM5_POPAL
MTIQQYQDSGADQGAFYNVKESTQCRGSFCKLRRRNQPEQHIQSAANLQGTLDEPLTKTLRTKHLLLHFSSYCVKGSLKHDQQGNKRKA